MNSNVGQIKPGHSAELKLNQTNGKWEAIFQGRVLATSRNSQYIIDTITRGMNKTANACGVTHVIDKNNHASTGDMLLTNGFEMPVKPEFTITERFEFLENLAEMAIEKEVNAVLVTGEGGIGKSYTIIGAVKNAGLDFTHQYQPPAPKAKNKKDDADSEAADDDETSGDSEDDEEEIEWVNPGRVHLIKGFSSPKGLYRALYENNGKLIIFDDCDDIHKNPTATNILKGALDSGEERWISWNAEEGRGAAKLPRNFQFTGQVIFISNKSQYQFDSAMKSRCARVDLTMTASEKIERMEYIIQQPSFEPLVDIDVKEESLDFLRENVDLATGLSLRSLLEVIKYRKQNKPNWKRQALYSLTA